MPIFGQSPDQGFLLPKQKPMQAMSSASHSSSPVHFYEIIWKPNLEKIMIPNKFTGRYGGGLPNPVFLKPPDGKEWKVGWTKQDDKVWFQEGWKEFASFYSLDEGHLVFFKYEGNSQFDVHIFDKSALEIDYLSSKDTSNQKEKLDNLCDDTIEILDEMPPNQRAGHETPLSSSRPQKKMRSTTNEDVEKRNSILQNLQEGMMKSKGGPFQETEFQKSTNAELKCCKQEPEEDMGARIFTNSACLNSEHRSKKSITAVEKIRALNSVSSFKSENPFFTVVMQPSYVNQKCFLAMPREFSEKYFKEKCGVVQLQALNGRTWPAKYKIPKIGAGWSKFVVDNNLKVGHICVFEMIDLSFKVHIFGDAEEGNLKVNPFKMEQISNMQLTPLERASSFKCENPHFMVQMTYSYIFGKTNLHVPLKFARTNLHHSPTNVILRVQDVDWNVGFAIGNAGNQQLAEFTWGWKQFLEDNGLKVGDVCVFELIQKIKFHVTIFQATEHPDHLID